MTRMNPAKAGRVTIVLAVTVLVLALAGGAATLAQGTDPSGDGDQDFAAGAFGHRIEAMARHLDLSSEQEEAIAALHQDNREQAMTLRKQLLRLRNELEGEMLVDEPQQKAVVELTEQIGQLKTELQVGRVETQLAVRAQLTPEQRDRMLMMKASHRGSRGRGDNRGEGRWAGRHGGHGPHGHGQAECDGEGPKGPHGRGGRDRDR